MIDASVHKNVVWFASILGNDVIRMDACPMEMFEAFVARTAGNTGDRLCDFFANAEPAAALAVINKGDIYAGTGRHGNFTIAKSKGAAARAAASFWLNNE